MPKYLLQVSYTLDGVKGVVSKGGSARRALSGGGRERRRTLESFYFAFGDTDVFAVATCRTTPRPRVGAERVGRGRDRSHRRAAHARGDRRGDESEGAVHPAGSDSAVILSRPWRPVGRAGRPVAPRAGVETGVGDPGDRHRQQVVAGGDSTSAVHDRCRPEVGEARGELVGRSVAAVEVEVVEVRQVDRARDVARSADRSVRPHRGTARPRGRRSGSSPLSTRSVMSSASTMPCQPSTTGYPVGTRATTSSVVGSPACFPGLVAAVEDGDARSWPIDRSIHHRREATAPPALS